MPIRVSTGDRLALTRSVIVVTSVGINAALSAFVEGTVKPSIGIEMDKVDLDFTALKHTIGGTSSVKLHMHVLETCPGYANLQHSFCEV